MSGMTFGGPQLTFKELLINRLDYLNKESYKVIIYDFHEFEEIVNEKFDKFLIHTEKNITFYVENPDFIFFKVTRQGFRDFSEDTVFSKKFPFTEEIFRKYFDEPTKLLCRGEVARQLKKEKEQEWQDQITMRMEAEEIL